MNHLWPSGVFVRDYRRDDRAALLRLLTIVPRLYPNGVEWLLRRLDDVESRKASCTLVCKNEKIGGVLIDTDKGLRSKKISTLFVADNLANQGLGSLLFSSCKMRWLRSGIEKLHITVAGQRRPNIEKFLVARNFQPIAFEPGRYGPMRDEIVYSMTLN